jgi:hypothetical protein
MHKLYDIGQTIHRLFTNLPHINVPPYWGTYKNQAVRIPHMSVGQYGFLHHEFKNLCTIVSAIAGQTKPITETMARELSIIPGYIFFDTEQSGKNVNPKIKDIYIKLRERFINEIVTKFIVSGVLFSKKMFVDNPAEMNLIEQHFQNWGIPEGDRMRPHFTMNYLPSYENETMLDALRSNQKLANQIEALSTITLTRLAIVHIDTFGNPLQDGLLFMCQLQK